MKKTNEKKKKSRGKKEDKTEKIKIFAATNFFFPLLLSLFSLCIKKKKKEGVERTKGGQKFY